MLADGGKKLDHRIEILRVRGVWIEPQIGQRHGDHVARAFQNGNAAVSKLGGIFRLEEDVERGQIRIGNALLHHVHIEGQAHGAPHVGNPIFVSRVPALNGFQAYRIKIAPVGQFRAVKRLIDLGYSEALEGGTRLDHHIETGAAGQHLGFHGFG